MEPIEDVIGAGGTIDVPRGFLKRTFELVSAGATVARLAWEQAPPGTAYFDTAAARYKIDVVERSHLTRRRTIQVCRASEVEAELHIGWRGGDGDAMTSRGHRYLLRRANGQYVLEREVGHETVCEISRRHIRQGRHIQLYAGHTEAKEVVSVVAGLVFHILAMDYASDRRALAAGGGG
jgi:hypothetical protein